MKRRRKVSAKVISVLGGTAIALLAGEIILRATGVVASMPFEPPTFAFRLRAFPCVAGDRNLHVPVREDTVRSESDPLRIAFLGDSVTYGLHVSTRETFVWKTGVLLNSRQDVPCVTINLGVPAEDLVREWAVYNDAKDHFRPDVVVHVLAENDLDVDLYRDLVPIARMMKERTWASQYSRLFELAEAKVRWLIAWRGSVDYMRGGATPEARERSWRIASYAIRATKRLVEEDGAIYILAGFPVPIHLDDYPAEGVHRRTAALARELGVPYLDLLDVFRGRDGDELRVPGDAHPSALGHSLAAEAFADFLAKEILAKPLVRKAATRPSVPRSPEEIRQATIRHYLAVLEVDPTCASARRSLDAARKEMESVRRTKGSAEG